MSGARQQAFSARLAGLAVVLALHGALFYSLWHARVPPPPAEAATLFVELLTDPVKPEPARLEPVKPEPPNRNRSNAKNLFSSRSSWSPGRRPCCRPIGSRRRLRLNPYLLKSRRRSSPRRPRRRPDPQAPSR